MDTDKLYQKIMNDEELKDIPIIFITKVICAVLRIINDGDCFYETEV